MKPTDEYKDFSCYPWLVPLPKEFRELFKRPSGELLECGLDQNLWETAINLAAQQEHLIEYLWHCVSTDTLPNVNCEAIRGWCYTARYAKTLVNTANTNSYLARSRP